MAVTVTQRPQQYTPSDNPVVYAFRQPLTVSGNTKYNVSFIVYAYINDGLIATFEIFPEILSTYHFGKIDLSTKVKSYIPNHPISGVGSNPIYNPGNCVAVSVVVYEKYSLNINDTPTIDTGSSVLDSYSYVFKGSLNRNEFINWDYTAYVKGVTTMQFLTSKEIATNQYNENLKKGDTTILSWFEGNTYGVTPTDYAVYYEYILPTGNVTVLKNVTGVSQGLVGALRFNLLNELSLGNISIPTYSDCTGVEIRLLSAFPDYDPISSLYKITFANECFDKGANLLWLNKYGSYDNFRFTYNSRISAKIESKSFSKMQGGWNGNTYVSTDNTSGKIDYLKTITKQLELSSDWLTEDEQAYVVNVYESPLIYLNDFLEVENVTITNSSYQLKQSEHDELFNEVINIEFSNYKSISL